EEDVRRVAAMREALGPEALLMVDANRGFNAESAIRLGRRLEPYDIFWFEEPVPPEDVEGYLEVKRALRTLIAGGECEYTRWGFERLLSRRAVDVVQPETCAAGGLTECLKIASLAELYGIRYVPHYFGAGVSLAAMLQLVASLPRPVSSEEVFFPQVEWDTSVNPLRDELLKEPLSPREGVIEVPQAPGLGIEVRREVLERYGVG
ncbi:MAG: mandelate racemase/muconate lactonizing enzyme family protein, partial [Nitrospinota bacterium]